MTVMGKDKDSKLLGPDSHYSIHLTITVTGGIAHGVPYTAIIQAP